MWDISPEIEQRLSAAQNIWVASVRPDGRPHLAPVWFVWTAGKLYISIEPESVKGRNMAQNTNVVLALEDGLHPVICEGQALLLPKPYPAEVLQAFLLKYEWDITQESQYNQIVEVNPRKWLAW